MLGGWLMGSSGMAPVFSVGGTFAVTGVVTFAAVLTHFHGAGALTEW